MADSFHPKYKKNSVLLGSKGNRWYHACMSLDVPSSRSGLVDVFKDQESFLSEISVRMPSLLSQVDLRSETKTNANEMFIHSSVAVEMSKVLITTRCCYIGTVMPCVRQALRILCGSCKILSAACMRGIHIKYIHCLLMCIP